MKLLVALAAVFLVLLVALDGLVEAHCKMRLFRSPDRSTLKLRISGSRCIYLSLVDRPDFPAIQFLVDRNEVIVFNKQARAEKKSVDLLLASQDNLSRQFQHHQEQFRATPKAAILRGGRILQDTQFYQSLFQLEHFQVPRYKVSLADVPNFSLQFKMDLHFGLYYELKSPLYDLKMHIDDTCKFLIVRRGVRVDLQALDFVEARRDWNPMDPNSWTLFDGSLEANSFPTQNQNLATSSSIFAKPLPLSEPLEPENPVELE